MGLFDLGGDDSSGFFSPKNILGALAVGSQIWGNYKNEERSQEAAGSLQDFKAQELAENRRQFDLTYQLQQAKLAQGAGGGDPNAAAALALQAKTAKSRAMQGAYQSLIEATLAGRHGEAQMLSRLVDQLQNVTGSVRR